MRDFAAAGRARAQANEAAVLAPSSLPSQGGRLFPESELLSVSVRWFENRVNSGFSCPSTKPVSVTSQGQQLPEESRIMKDDLFRRQHFRSQLTSAAGLASHGGNRAAISFQTSETSCEKIADKFREFCIPCDGSCLHRGTPPSVRSETNVASSFSMRSVFSLP